MAFTLTTSSVSLHDVYNTPSLLLSAVTFLLLVTWIRGYFQPENLPPGPKGWPVLGFLPQGIGMMRRGMNLNEILTWFGEKYGAVSSFVFFGYRVVVINGYQTVHDVLNRHDLNARSAHGDVKSQADVNPRYQTGVLFSSGDLWKEIRKFSVTTLRGFGIGKRSFEEQIAAESEHLLQELSSTRGSPYNPTKLLCHAVSNVICSVVFGERFQYSDPKFEYFLHLLDYKLLHPIWLIVNVTFPKVKRIPFGPARRQIDEFTAIREHILTKVEEHTATLDHENPRDFIDVYLKEILSKNQQDDNLMASTFADNLIAVVDDLFVAGTETTSTTLRWGLLYMMAHPKIQTRVQQEIDSVVGRDRLPRLSDKAAMPYTEAVIHEIQRMGSIVHMTGPRYVKQCTKLNGFEIPKGTLIIPNLYSATRDPSLWEDPETFKPERFLDDQGLFKKPKEFIVFGSGRRVCLGEQLARMELFIFFSHLMHRFSFSNETGDLNLKPIIMVVCFPSPYEIRAIER